MPADGNSSAKIEEKRKAHELGGGRNGAPQETIYVLVTSMPWER